MIIVRTDPILTKEIVEASVVWQIILVTESKMPLSHQVILQLVNFLIINLTMSTTYVILYDVLIDRK